MLVFCLLLFACKGKDKKVSGETGFDYKSFAASFKKADLPFLLTDTGLLTNKDTAWIRSADFAAYVPDSLKKKVFGTSKLKYAPLARLEVPKAETYFIVKASSGTKRAAFILSFDKSGQYAATLPFLVPDNDPATSQTSSIDKAYSISRNVTRKNKNDINAEGKDVYAYNNDAKQFTLIMTDLLDETSGELINPIDTLPKTHKYAGDYSSGKKNLISIRDSRNSNQVMAFVHLEKNEGTCIAELKGDLFFTSSTTAIYRQGGDPCVLQFVFANGTVSIKEEEGCGNHRGLDCKFEGSFSKKREQKAKTSTKKGIKK
jgi:hypothetical protein